MSYGHESKEMPKCDKSRHTWRRPWSIVGGLKENPGVHGKGGGVIITDVCITCGCARHTDTWADDGRGGVRRGNAVTYIEGQYADEVAA